MARLRRWLTEPVDLARLVVFRILFGAMLTWEVLRYLAYDWVYLYYVEPTFHFTYPGFSWVRPWPEPGMTLHFALLGVASLCVCLGLFYRAAAVAVWLGWTYVFLLDQTGYLNHMYLICLLAFLMVWAPANGEASLDRRWQHLPRATEGPRWGLFVVQAQVALVYVFGGIAKLHADWLSGIPGSLFLEDWELTEPLAQDVWVSRLFAWAGTAFDLFIVPLLLWRRTRPLAICAAVAFHVTNSQLFHIGIFPWLMLGATVLFLPSRWSRRLLGAPGQPHAVGVPALAQRLAPALVAGWLVLQVLLPLRHWLYPGDVNWTEEGHNFSWHMKLRVKSGDATFYAVDRESGEVTRIELDRYLNERQARKMSTRPDMMHAFALHLGEELGKAIHVDAHVSLNERPPARIVDPNRDLASEPRTLWPAPWILPLPEDAPGDEGRVAGK